MAASFRNALHFTTFLFCRVKFSTQGIIPSKSDSFCVLFGKVRIQTIIPSKRDWGFVSSGKIQNTGHNSFQKGFVQLCFLQINGKSMHGNEGIVLSGNLYTHVHTPKGHGNFHVPSFKQITWKGTRKFPCTLTRHITRRGTQKFPCTFTQITRKEERGNFHVSSQPRYKRALRQMQKDARR